jgi:hypothetical protein
MMIETKRRNFPLYILIQSLFCGCPDDTSVRETASVEPGPELSPLLSITDSIDKYASHDTLVVGKAVRFYAGTTGSLRFALVEQTDTSCLLYQSNGGG